MTKTIFGRVLQQNYVTKKKVFNEKLFLRHLRKEKSVIIVKKDI